MSDYKFKVGQFVKVIKSGYGCRSEEVRKTVKIIEQGIYSDGNGYKVEPARGNSRTGSYEGFIGEESFELDGMEIQRTIE